MSNAWIKSSGDVTAASNLTDDAVVVGDGGAKGVKTLASLGTSGQVLTSNGAGTPPSFEELPSQLVAFNGYKASGSNDSNVTGDGAQFFIGSGNPLTEAYDLGSNFNTNGTFTAPIDGIYSFTSNITLFGLTASHTLLEHDFVTTGTANTFRAAPFSPGGVMDVNNFCANSFSITIPLSTNDTVKTRIRIYNGTKVVGLFGLPNYTNFSGYLVART